MIVTLVVLLGVTPSWGQLPSTGGGTNGLRPATTSSLPSTSSPVMVPLNPSHNFGFDPYSPSPNLVGAIGSLSGAILNSPSAILPPTIAYQPPSLPYSGPSVGSSVNPALTTPGAITPGLPAGNFGPSAFGTSPPISVNNPYGTYPGLPAGSPLGGWGTGSYPQYNGPSPMLPGSGQSAIVQTTPSILPNGYSQPGVFPNSSPSALFPGSYGSGSSGGLFGNLFGGGGSSNWGAATANPWSGGYNAGAFNAGLNGPYDFNGVSGWNPQGTMFNGGTMPGFVRLFQGPRIRHSYVHGDKQDNDVSIHDTDLAIAMLLPNFAFSTQPIYILPSFSLHQWAGPRPDLSPTNNADLPSKAYSAFIDAGWQSEPARILGAELGLRVGVFSDFDTFTSRSLRVMGRGIGRIRLTPQATLKLGVMYLDRNRIKLLPAGGILWQPNPATRLDLFFPEPKLSAFLSTIGNFDTWWYVAGYYGGGSWTVRRTDNSKDSIDINDIRATLGLEWGRNDMMRDGRRVGFAEVGYVFDRELLYKARPGDNLRLQDTFVIRIGLGY